MRFVRYAIVILIIVVAAYFLGFSGGIVESNEREDNLWQLVQHRNEGPVCFNTLEDGTSRILVTPKTQSIVPSCMQTHHTSAAFIVNETDFEINVRSNFRLSFRTTPCVTQDIGDYPLVTERLGQVESGEYDVHHGEIYLGTIQLPVEEPESISYGQCLQPPAISQAESLNVSLQ